MQGLRSVCVREELAGLGAVKFHLPSSSLYKRWTLTACTVGETLVLKSRQSLFSVLSIMKPPSVHLQMQFPIHYVSSVKQSHNSFLFRTQGSVLNLDWATRDLGSLSGNSRAE